MLSCFALEARFLLLWIGQEVDPSSHFSNVAWGPGRSKYSVVRDTSVWKDTNTRYERGYSMKNHVERKFTGIKQNGA